MRIARPSLSAKLIVAFVLTSILAIATSAQTAYQPTPENLQSRKPASPPRIPGHEIRYVHPLGRLQRARRRRMGLP